MRSTPRINPDKLVAIVGGIFLLGLVLSSWVPQPCPFLRQALIGCPLTTEPLVTTPAEDEMARVPHQDITTPSAIIQVTPDQNRTNAQVTFEYREKDPTKTPIAYLQMVTASGTVNLALISHPLLSGLTWGAVADSQFRLYQRTPTYGTLADFSASLPPAATLAADEVAVRKFNLKPGTYQPLETLASLTGINYVLTSYVLPIPDGQTWHVFKQAFDLTDASLDQDGKLELSIQSLNFAAGDDLLLSTVHLDFYYEDRPL
jgi:hypothetical protein